MIKFIYYFLEDLELRFEEQSLEIEVQCSDLKRVFPIFFVEEHGLALMPIPLSVFKENKSATSATSSASSAARQLANSIYQEAMRWKQSRSNCEKVIFLYEDTLLKDRQSVEDRLRCHFNRGDKFFAKYCLVKKISKDVAMEFAARTHSYGAVGAKHFYGLYKKRGVAKLTDSFQVGELLAVCSFSAVRLMKYEDNRRSFQWINFSALPALRVVGGMGKLLNKFIQDYNPDDIVTYGDKEWSQGDVYEKLGFEMIGEREPILYAISGLDHQRIPLINRQQDIHPQDGDVIISNLGSLKYRLRLANQ